MLLALHHRSSELLERFKDCASVQQGTVAAATCATARRLRRGSGRSLSAKRLSARADSADWQPRCVWLVLPLFGQPLPRVGGLSRRNLSLSHSLAFA